MRRVSAVKGQIRVLSEARNGPMNLARCTIAEVTGVMGGAEVEVVGAKTAAVARALGYFFLQSGFVQLLCSALGFAFYFSKCRCAALIAITMVLC